MALITQENMDAVIKKCLTAFCDKKILDRTSDIDPDGYLKVRLVIWRYGPYKFQAKYIFGGKKGSVIWLPLGFTAVLDGDTEEKKLTKIADLAKRLHHASFMRECGFV